MGRPARSGAALEAVPHPVNRASALATLGETDGPALSSLTNPTTGLNITTTLGGPVLSPGIINHGGGPPAPAAPAETASAGTSQHDTPRAATGHPMTLPSSPTARMAIIREMMAFAVAPSSRAAGSLPAPRLNPARALDTGTATAADVRVRTEPLAVLSPASVPLGDGGQAEEPGAPSTTPSLSSALSLRGPTWPLASDTEVLLEAQLGAFTSLVGPGRSDWRRITPSAFLGITPDAARDEHFYIGPADLPSTWALIVHSRTLLHPEHTTSVTVVALRKWRPYLCTAAGSLAFPAEGPGDHLRFRLRGQTKAACPAFDTWHLTLSPPAHVEQQSLSGMRRDERRELNLRLQAGRQGEVFDGGGVALNARLLRRAHDPRERTYPMPGSAPDLSLIHI